MCNRATSHGEWTTPCHHKSSLGFESNIMVYHAMTAILMLIHWGYLCEYMYSEQSFKNNYFKDQILSTHCVNTHTMQKKKTTMYSVVNTCTITV